MDGQMPPERTLHGYITNRNLLDEMMQYNVFGRCKPRIHRFGIAGAMEDNQAKMNLSRKLFLVVEKKSEEERILD
jgi:hypothetical protein